MCGRIAARSYADDAQQRERPRRRNSIRRPSSDIDLVVKVDMGGAGGGHPGDLRGRVRAGWVRDVRLRVDGDGHVYLPSSDIDLVVKVDVGGVNGD